MFNLNGSFENMTGPFQGLIDLISPLEVFFQDQVDFFKGVDTAVAHGQDRQSGLFGQAEITGRQGQPGIVMGQLHIGWSRTAGKGKVHQFNIQGLHHFPGGLFKSRIFDRDDTS